MASTERQSPLTGRAAAIRDAARELLEHEGPDGLAMRALAHRVGAHPPAVYRHFQDKSAIEAAVVSQALVEVGDAMRTALEHGDDDGLTAVARAYRAWAVAHPHLYRLTMGRPLDPAVDEDALLYAAGPLREVSGGDITKSRAVWACMHGLTMLQLDGRLPPDADIEEMWAFTLHSLREQIAA